MEKQDQTEIVKKQNIVYWAVAVVLFVAFLALFWAGKSAARERTYYSVVIMGDSLTGLCRDETSVASILQERLGKPVYNGAFGGTCIALHNEDIADNYTMELLNMTSLAKALEADDFGAQQTVRSRREITDYFADTIDELEQIDFRQVDTVVLAFGINDYHAGIPLDNAENPYDETCFGGAMRSVLRSLQKTHPQLRIILLTPTYAWYRQQHLTCEEYRTGEAFLEEYVWKEMEIAQEMNLEAIDLYHNVYPHEEWSDWKIYTIDGLHPNEDGRRMIADMLAKKIAGE